MLEVLQPEEEFGLDGVVMAVRFLLPMPGISYLDSPA
jgi:hypothetical protein